MKNTCSGRFVWQGTIRADDLHNTSARFTDFAREDARTMWGAGGETFPVLLVCGERWWARSSSISLSQWRWRLGRERKTPCRTGTTPSSTDREQERLTICTVESLSCLHSRIEKYTNNGVFPFLQPSMRALLWQYESSCHSVEFTTRLIINYVNHLFYGLTLASQNKYLLSLLP